MRTLPFAALILAAAGLVASPASRAGISRDEPIHNQTDVPVASNSAASLTIDQVRQAILTACPRRGWVCRVTGPGEIRAVLEVRKHRAEASITFSTASYSIRYVSSENLRYNAAKNEIHRKYNQWTANLRQDIDVTIASTR